MKAFQSSWMSWERRVTETPITMPERRRDKEDWRRHMAKMEEGLEWEESWEDILIVEEKQLGPVVS
jgi:hypothetical protein